jgi:hypothetical protein
MHPGGDPAIWIGKLTNPRTVYAHFDVKANMDAQRYYDGTRAAEASLAFLDQEEPDNTKWRSHLQNLGATALWRLDSRTKRYLQQVRACKMLVWLAPSSTSRAWKSSTSRCGRRRTRTAKAFVTSASISWQTERPVWKAGAHIFDARMS